MNENHVGTIFIRLKDQESSKKAHFEIQEWLECYGWAHAVEVRTEENAVGSEIQFIAGPLQSNESRTLVFKTVYDFKLVQTLLASWLSEKEIQASREILIEA